MSEGAHTTPTFEDREQPAYDGDWKDLAIESQHRRNLDYQRPGGVDVEPGSLEDFANRMEDDIGEFSATRQAVNSLYFTNMLHPMVMTGSNIDADNSGGASGESAGLPEAMGYHQAYSQLEAAMHKMMFDIEGGLTGLQMCASFVHMAYEAADMMAGDSLGSPFAEYGGVLDTLGISVNGMFDASRHDAGRSVSGEAPDTGELSEEDQVEIEDQWQQHIDGQSVVDNRANSVVGPMESDLNRWDRTNRTEVSAGDDEVELHIGQGPPAPELPSHPAADTDNHEEPERDRSWWEPIPIIA